MRRSPTFVRDCTPIGERDTQMQLLGAACGALPAIDKAHKWFVTRGDLDYTALWILYAATLARQDRSAERAPASWIARCCRRR